MAWKWNTKDGGPDSKVWMYGFESKRFGSILLLRFGQGSREAFHTHAFNSVSWLLSGGLDEYMRMEDDRVYLADRYRPGRQPIFTYRSTFHQVLGRLTANWVLTFRGPWVDKWNEYSAGGHSTLTHGRKVVQ